MKNRVHIDTDELNTVSECLRQLANAEEAQLSIEEQLAMPNSSDDLNIWRKRAENALRVIKGKRRLITARLAVLRQEEKERNILSHQQHNDYLVAELKQIVTPSSFLNCVRRADKKLENIERAI